MLKKIVELKLKYLARRVLNRHQPDIIGITGSVGKTSAKEAIYAVLNKDFSSRRSEKNYNNEIGVPLAVIGEDSPGRSLSGWIRVFRRAARLAARGADYPKILILEMGVDRPGDMDYLLSFIKCRIGVITAIGQAHMEYFGSVDGIKKEKGKLIENLRADGTAVINSDDPKAREIAAKSRTKIITYGFGDRADVRALEIRLSFGRSGGRSGPELNNLSGTSFKLAYLGSAVPVFLPRMIGDGAVYAALAAAAVGLAYGQNLIEIAESLRGLVSPRGRMNLLSGLNESLIIDDSYNASPQSAANGLKVLKDAPLASGARRIAVLGDMLELGSESEAGHFETGVKAARAKIRLLALIGGKALGIGEGARRAGLADERIRRFMNQADAARYLRGEIRPGDLIYVKASQGMRLEKLIREIMAEPERAGELLVRQDKAWEKR